MWFFIIWLGCGLLASGLWLWNVRELQSNDRDLWREALGSCLWLAGIGPFGLYAVIKVMRT